MEGSGDAPPACFHPNCSELHALVEGPLQVTPKMTRASIPKVFVSAPVSLHAHFSPANRWQKTYEARKCVQRGAKWSPSSSQKRGHGPLGYRLSPGGHAGLITSVPFHAMARNTSQLH